jgi:hypothetical protein
MSTIDPATVTVTMTDVTLAGHCPRGTKNWFDTYAAEDSRFDFRTFLAHGISGDVFLSKGDPYAQQVYDRKLERG